MSFTTPCFVRVKNSKECRKLIWWLKDVGYIVSPFVRGKYIEAYNYKVGQVIATNSKPEGPYDCGSNIELFKALAAMNDENDYRQFFIHRNNKYAWVLCNTRQLFDCISLEQEYRKATAEEIIEYFKKFKKH